MYQALPPLFFRAGQRSYVSYCMEAGNEASFVYIPQFLLASTYILLYIPIQNVLAEVVLQVMLLTAFFSAYKPVLSLHVN